MHKDKLFILHRDYGRDEAFQHGAESPGSWGLYQALTMSG